MKFVFAAGGTGGHINPALAVAGELKRRYPDADILFLGTKEKMESKLVPAAGFNFRYIDISGFQRKLTPANLRANIKTLWKILKASRQSREILEAFQPDVVIGFGGYVSGPVVRQGAKLGFKTAIHEQNAFPGVANKALAKKADLVMLTVPEAEKYLSCKKTPVSCHRACEFRAFFDMRPVCIISHLGFCRSSSEGMATNRKKMVQTDIQHPSAPLSS